MEPGHVSTLPSGSHKQASALAQPEQTQSTVESASTSRSERLHGMQWRRAVRKARRLVLSTRPHKRRGVIATGVDAPSGPSAWRAAVEPWLNPTWGRFGRA